MTHTKLRGKIVLLLEDDFLIGLELASYVEGLGMELAGPVNDISEARRISDTRRIDVALLDVNIKGKSSVELARSLMDRNVPCAFLTGYSSIPAAPDVPIIGKPVLPQVLERSLLSLLLTG